MVEGTLQIRCLRLNAFMLFCLVRSLWTHRVMRPSNACISSPNQILAIAKIELSAKTVLPKIANTVPHHCLSNSLAHPTIVTEDVQGTKIAKNAALRHPSSSEQFIDRSHAGKITPWCHLCLDTLSALRPACKSHAVSICWKAHSFRATSN